MDSRKPTPDPRRLLEDGRWMRGVAAALVGDGAAADDLVQDAVLAALDRPAEAGRPVRPYLAGILRLRSRQGARADERRARRERAAARPEAVPSTDELVERVDMHRTVAEELVALEEPYRTTLLLRFHEDWSAGAIASHQGLPAATVRGRIRDGLARLRERLDRRFGGDRAHWAGLLLPMANAVPPAAPAAPTALAALFTMKNLAVVSAVILVAVGLVRFLPTAPREPEGEARASAPDEGGDVATADDPVAEPSSGTARRAVDPDAADAPAPSATGALASTPRYVVDARFLDASRDPVAGVELTTGRTLGAGTFARSGADGRAALDLTAVSGEGRLPRTVELRAIHPAHAQQRLFVYLTEDGAESLGEVVLQAGGTLRGSVVDASGDPVAGATVWFGGESLDDERVAAGTFEPGAPPARSVPSAARTDPQGRYALVGVPAIATRLLGHDAAGERFGASELIRVRAGDELECAPLALRAPEAWGRLEGRVVDRAGEPVAGAQLLVVGVDEPEHLGRGAVADADGSFGLWLESDREYALRAHDPEGAMRAAEVAPVFAGTSDLVVVLGEERWLEVFVHAGGTPVTPANVVLRGADGAILESGRVLPPGSVGAVEFVEGATLSLEPEEADEVEPGLVRLGLPAVPFHVSVEATGFDPREVGPLEPTAAPGRIAVELQPRARGVLAGRVTFEGAPVPDAWILLLPRRPESRFRSTDRRGDLLRFVSRRRVDLRELERSGVDGRFAYPFVEAGSFDLVVLAPDAPETAAGRPAFVPLELDPSLELEELVVELPRAGSLEGAVLLPPDRDASGLWVGACNGEGLVFTGAVDADGRYAIDGLAPGEWQVGLAPREAMRGVLGGGALELPLETPLEFDVEVAAGEVARFDLDLRVSDASCRLAGRFSLDGAAPAGFAAELRLADSTDLFSFQSTPLDADGSFAFEVTEPGRYRVSVSGAPGANRIFLQQEVDLVRGANTWTYDYRTERVAGARTDAPESWGEYLFYGWFGPSGEVASVAFRAGADGVFDLPFAHAGAGALLRRPAAFPSPPLTEWSVAADVPAGGDARTSIELR